MFAREACTAKQPNRLSHAGKQKSKRKLLKMRVGKPDSPHNVPVSRCHSENPACLLVLVEAAAQPEAHCIFTVFLKDVTELTFLQCYWPDFWRDALPP